MSTGENSAPSTCSVPFLLRLSRLHRKRESPKKPRPAAAMSFFSVDSAAPALVALLPALMPWRCEAVKLMALTDAAWRENDRRISNLLVPQD